VWGLGLFVMFYGSVINSGKLVLGMLVTFGVMGVLFFVLGLGF
jgi:hypothetical protein